jgi:hypothetical protein
MALNSCPECGGKVSSNAKACPHCGHSITSGRDSLERAKDGVGSIWSFCWIIVALLGLFALGNMVVSCAQEMF